MFNLNEQFLEELGLGGLPDEQKKPFLQHIYAQLEKRVGEKLSDGMTEEQLDEFGAIIDHREDVVKAWVQSHVPDYQTREDFQRLQTASGFPPESLDLISEYVATKWLEFNRPDYRQVVASTLEEIKQEITSNKDAILGNSGPAN